MPAVPDIGPPPGALPPSPRARLARTALAAACSHPAVVRGHPGPAGLHATESGGHRVVGVRAIADGQGRFELSLCLVAAPVPLHALADDVRARVRRAAAGEGLEGRIGRLEVEIADVDESIGFPVERVTA
jgi:hypothetical protein